MRQAPGVFENFNAKLLTTKQLTEGFIVNSAFTQLCGQNHTLLVGPRGSGKTTLLKMLQVEALAQWEDPAAEKIRVNVDFCGVFIPTDPVWSKQYDYIEDKVRLDPDLARCLKSLFTYHVLECLTNALIFRTAGRANKSLFKHVDLDTEQEIKLVDSLSEIWQISAIIPSLRGLLEAIIGKIHALGTVFNDHVDGGNPIGPNGNIIQSSLVLTILTSVKIINAAMNEPDAKWCFLFDELELAPSTIMSELMPTMRGGSPNIIYKLSLVPYIEDEQLAQTFFSPQENNDFSRVELTREEQVHPEEFAVTLCNKVFQRHGLTNDAKTYFDEPPSESYEELVPSLSSKDQSFTAYLFQKGIDPLNIPVEESKGRWEIRKLRWPLLIREHYIKTERRMNSFRSPAPFYAGFDTLCRALEFNPRMLIGTMNKFAQVARTQDKISISTQLEILRDAETAFSAQLNTIPLSRNGPGTLADFVDRLGIFVRDRQVLGDEFFAEPKGTFVLTNRADPSVIDAVKNGLNTGALIRVPGSEGTLDERNDQNKLRLRLSNIFSHRFRIPATVMRAISLEDVLSDAHLNDNTQLELW